MIRTSFEELTRRDCGASKICPVCDREFFEGVMSIKRGTEICPDCGVIESIESWETYMKEKGVRNEE